MHKIIFSIIFRKEWIIVVTASLLTAFALYAWTDPTASPPAGNVVPSGSSGSGSGDILFPDGSVGVGKNLLLNSVSTYTVPAGKTLYINSVDNIGSGAVLRINGVDYYILSPDFASIHLPAPFIVGAGKIVSVFTPSGSVPVTGLEVSSGVTGINREITNVSTYTVTVGKTLYIMTFYGIAGGSAFRINGSTYLSTDIPGPVIIPGGSVLSSSTATPIRFTGYEK